MKKSSLIAVFFVCCLGSFIILMPSPAKAVMYEVQSLYQSISGEISGWEYVGFDEETGNDIYTPYSGNFFHESISSPEYMFDMISGGNDIALASLESNFNGSGFSASIHTGFFSPQSGYIQNQAYIDLVFRPYMTSIWKFYGSFGSELTLKDLTNDDVLIFELMIMDSNTDNNICKFILNPSHNYELTMLADGYFMEDDYTAYSYISADISSVPEPSCLLLLCLGLVGLAGVRRKFKK